METVRQFLFTLIDQYPQAVFFTGLGLIGVGLVWMLILLFSMLRKAIIPVLLLLVGTVVLVGPWVLSYSGWLKDTRPRERVVGGDLALTVTGADFNYNALLDMPDLKILQMANPDVNDAALKNLVHCKHLKDLDLSKTGITDEGLATLAQLPLQKLHLENTNITDAGFRKHLMPLDTLTQLNLRGTKVEKTTGTEWKKANPERRLIQ